MLRRKQNRFPKRCVALLSLVCSRSVCVCVLFQICCSLLVFWSSCDCDLCVGVIFLPPVFSGFKCLYMCVSRFVALWFVILSLCDLYVDVLLIDLFRFLVFWSLSLSLSIYIYIFFFFLVLRHQTMDKVHKHNSTNNMDMFLNF
jgi:hypothetical protein